MPKRKRDDTKSYIREKIRKLERKLLKGRRNRRLSSSSDSLQLSDDPQADTICESVNVDNTIFEEFNETEPGPSTSAQHDVQDTSLIPEIIEDAVQSDEHATPIIENNQEQQLPELDEISLEILGADPSNTTTYGKDIQKDLALRFEFISTSGLTKERRKELLESHLPPGNCKMIDAPTLNPEIKAAINDNMVKRDKAMLTKQKQISSAIACLGEAISILLAQDTKDPVVLKLLMDTSRLICDTQYNISITRRNFIMAVLKKELKDQIQLTKIDNLLFGRDLADTLKTAKAINKSGAELKVAASSRSFTQSDKPKPAPVKPNLNWKAPVPNRRPAGPPRAKESAPLTRPPPPHSSRPSRGRSSATRGRQY